ncbi:MAG: L-threonylcarbamoyladenylate synthase [Chitinophagaceae bacterium]
MTAFENDIKECLAVLETGGIILYPTDTIWGIGCDATNANAVAKIFALKQRSDEKSMVVLVSDEATIPKYITQPNLKVFDYIKGIHKPTTVIYQGAVGLATGVLSSDGTAAIRIVKEDFCKALIERLGRPLVSTSANISGYPAPTIFNDIDIAIKNGVDYVVQYRQEEDSITQPSAIIKWGDDGQLHIIRP